jgi:hypothetical protein
VGDLGNPLSEVALWFQLPRKFCNELDMGVIVLCIGYPWAMATFIAETAGDGNRPTEVKEAFNSGRYPCIPGRGGNMDAGEDATVAALPTRG